ncbi:hypothetical protein RHGRI_024638 [Rhododendron griersonianum]|uniref:Uncharacterized protein n=1 Tax=Rhododendron griersonianum TaxID=479676 RepID=A0AAV6J806_9ERIC|nr:hypothetical protein RHGRI_024638 [Rhododendron griersonianum]
MVRTSLGRSQLPLFLPQLDRLGRSVFRTSALSARRFLLKSGAGDALSNSLSLASSLLNCPSRSLSLTALLSQPGFLPVSISTMFFCMYGPEKLLLTVRDRISCSFGTFALNLFLEGGILVQKISLKFPITPLLYGLSLRSYRYLKFSKSGVYLVCTDEVKMKYS